MRSNILSDERAMRLLKRGGMAVPAGEVFRVYRTRDARLTSAGVLPKQVVDELLSTGKLAKDRIHAARLIWDGLLPQPSVLPQVGTPPKPPAARTRRPRRSLLQAVLHRLDDVRERERLAKAATRFQYETARAASGPIRSMNWNFVPNGGRKVALAGVAGQSGDALDAGANLKALSGILAPDQMTLLESVLIWEQTAPKIAARLGKRRQQIIEEFAEALYKLAWAYDTALPRER